MGFVGEAIGGIFGSGGDDAAAAAQRGADIQAQYQQEALKYLKEKEKIPRQFSEAALKRLGGIYGIEGGEGTQQELIEMAKASPLFDAIMGGREAGEESILRHAPITGGLRSGDIQSAFYDYNRQLENEALLKAYNQQLAGLQGLASLPSLTPQIAQQTGQIGQTLGQGQIAAAQIGQASQQQNINNLMGLGQLALAAATAFSDSRLKKNITKIGTMNNYNIYSWTWNEKANSFGLFGDSKGVLADEVIKIHPEAVNIEDGYMKVNYNKLRG